MAVRPLPGTDVRFLWWLIDASRWQLAASSVGSTYDAVTADIVGATPVVLPPLDEQRAIADYLDAETARIDALIAKKQRLRALVDRRWTELVVGSIASLEHSAPSVRARYLLIGSIGGSWGSDPGEGEIDARCVRGTDFDTDVLAVRVDGAPLRGFSRVEIRSRVLRPGDVIIEKSGGGDTQPVGRAVVWSGAEPAVPTNFAARLRPGPQVDGRFAAYVLRAAYERGTTRRWINQTTGIQNLDLGGLLSEPWPKPPIDEQVAMVRKLDDANENRLGTRRALERQIGLLRERRQALITAAVTGVSATGA